jgi:ABC-type molybdate transport system substrate-binding protein
VILPWAKDMAAAQALRAFVLGSEGKAVLRRYGFSLPGE